MTREIPDFDAMLAHCTVEIRSRYLKLIAERDALRAKVEKFGRHLDECDSLKDYDRREHPDTGCTCGFDTKEESSE